MSLNFHGNICKDPPLLSWPCGCNYGLVKTITQITKIQEMIHWKQGNQLEGLIDSQDLTLPIPQRSLVAHEKINCLFQATMQSLPISF